MSTPSGWQRKLITIFRSEKRLGANTIIKTFNDKSIEEMKATIITESMCDPEKLTGKPRTKDLFAHLDNIKHQFIGQPELCFYQVALIVLLRREYKPKETFAEFEALWTTQTEFLLKHLSLRWIISACDTFVDRAPDEVRAAILMNATTLINTLRVYETKQFLQLGSTNSTELNPVITDNVEALYRSDMPLYGGLTYFRAGFDDTLKNMRNRYEKFYDIDTLATTILLSVFDKLQTPIDNNSNAFTTMRDLHKSERSIWWEE